MEYRWLGRTGLRISVLSFGAAPLGNMFGKIDESDGAATVHAALDAGINFFDTSPYYGRGISESRLGNALAGHRADVLIGTKAGRFGDREFDYRPSRIRQSLEASLRALNTHYVDIFQLHDIEFMTLDVVFEDAYAELLRLRDAGKCRFIGMTGYPMHTLRRAVSETELDTVLSYAHHTLLNTQLATELRPLCEARGTALINAAPVAVGLLTTHGTRLPNHPAGATITAAAARVVRHCAQYGVDSAFLANQFAIQRSGCPTTLVGTARPGHLADAVRAASTPLDEQLLTEVLALTSDVHGVSWSSGLTDNNVGPLDHEPASA